MITGISIENFKGIGERIDIELKPLTLLFGANSAGKSTVLHALHFAREVFERGNLDADRTLAGGPFVDLGGFRNFVHMRDLDLPITLSFRLDLQDTPLPDYGTLLPNGPGDEYFPHDALVTDVRRCEVRLDIAWSRQDAGPYAREYAVSLDGQWFGVIHKEPERPGCTLRTNLAHPSLRSGADVQLLKWWGAEPNDKLSALACLFLNAALRQSIASLTLESQHDNASIPATATIVLGGQKDALPRWEQTLSFATDFERNEDAAHRPVRQYTMEEIIAKRAELLAKAEAQGITAKEALAQSKALVEEVKKIPIADEDCDAKRAELLRKAEAQTITAQEAFAQSAALFEEVRAMASNFFYEDFGAEYGEATHEWIIQAVSQLLVGPGQLVRDALTDFRYLGPLRETPSRDHAPPRFADPSRWASGLGAWDRLASGEEKLVDAVSHWLGDRERLNAGYNVHCKKFWELDRSDPVVVQLLSGKALDEAHSIRLTVEKLPIRSRIQIVPTTEYGHNSRDHVEMQPQDVGVGISQVVPVIVTALDEQRRLVAIEQPELHLHPALQVNIAELFIHRATQPKSGACLIETHSEHILLRLLRRIRETSTGELPGGHPGLTPDQVSVVCVEKVDGSVHAYPLRIDKTGEFMDRWPRGFFEERAEELF